LPAFAPGDREAMIRRGHPESPARTVPGQRELEAPTVLVVNQHSLSNAGDFTEGYRAPRRGRGGEPTAGWIVRTWGASLLDGTGFRPPRRPTSPSSHRR
jgi:tricorn protease